MRPLSHRQKQWAQDYLVRGPLRPIAKRLFLAALVLEERWFAATSGTGRALPPGKIAAVIKTFQRPRACSALVASIRRQYPDLPIVVVDDSREPGEYPGCRVVRLPFDSGLSAGRNAGIAAVDTEYVLNLDDDFLFYSRTALGGALEILERHPEIDLLGGTVVDLPLFITHDFRAAGLFPTDAEPRIAPGTRIGPAVVMDKVANFFLARTASVRSVGWDPALKLVEHADFFTRARGRIVSAQWDGWRILHRRDPFDRDYLEFRQNLASSLTHLRRKYGLTPPGS